MYSKRKQPDWTRPLPKGARAWPLDTQFPPPLSRSRSGFVAAASSLPPGARRQPGRGAGVRPGDERPAPRSHPLLLGVQRGPAVVHRAGRHERRRRTAWHGGPAHAHRAAALGRRRGVAVCARFYGGTKLGAGGLARAYASGVKRALDACERVAEGGRGRGQRRGAVRRGGARRARFRRAGGDRRGKDYAATVRYRVLIPGIAARSWQPRLPMRRRAVESSPPTPGRRPVQPADAGWTGRGHPISGVLRGSGDAHDVLCRGAPGPVDHVELHLSPSVKLLNPSPWIAEKCTKQSFPPSLEMKPKPF